MKRLLPTQGDDWAFIVAMYDLSFPSDRKEWANKYGFKYTESFQRAMRRLGYKVNNRKDPVEVVPPEPKKEQEPFITFITPWVSADTFTSTIPIDPEVAYKEQGIKATSDYKLPPDSTWEEHLSAIKSVNKIVAFHQETPEVVNIYYNTKLPIALTHMADIQLGQFGVDYESFERDCDTIANTAGLYVDIGGDMKQNIIQPSKIGSSHNQIPISIQNGLVVLTFKKLASHINSVRTGNHDHWTANMMGEDWLGETMKKLKLIYTKHGARINLHVGNQVYPYMARHVGKYNSSFNLTHSNKQEQRMNYPWARFTVFEHQHLASMEQYRYAGQECVAIRTGTYAVRDDYAEQWGFYGAHVSNPTVVLYPDQDKIVGFKDMYDAIIYLKAVRGESGK